MSGPEPRETRSLGVYMTVGAWLLVLGLLTAYFSGVLESREYPNRTVSTRVTTEGVAEVKLEQNRAGHYVARGTINGHEVRFLLDTGATDVAVPGSLAERLGLQAGRAQRVQTANGTITTYATRLGHVSLGDIRIENVSAAVNPHMDGPEVLLGMSFLRHLELVQRGPELTLRQHPE